MNNRAMEVFTFYLLCAVVIIAALGAVAAQNLVRSVIWFGVVLCCIAGFFVLLKAPFLALGQLVIFVGGLIPLLLFGIAFSAEENDATPQDRGANFIAVLLITNWPKIVLGILFFVVLFAAFRGIFFAGAAQFPADFMRFSTVLFIRYSEAVLLGVFGLLIAFITVVFFLEEDESH